MRNDPIAREAARRRERLTQLRTECNELLARSEALMKKLDALSPPHVKIDAAKFLKTDLKVGLTFTKIASQNADPAKRQRNQRKARTAYDTVQRHLRGAHLAEADEAEVQTRIAELRSALLQLGESL